MQYRYEPGDVVCIMPRNNEEFVNEALQRLKIDPDQKISIEKMDPSLWMLESLAPCSPRSPFFFSPTKKKKKKNSAPLRKDAPDFPIWLKNLFPISWRELFEKYFDIQSTPKRYFFELLAHFAESESEKDRLQYFGSAEGAV